MTAWHTWVGWMHAWDAWKLMHPAICRLVDVGMIALAICGVIVTRRQIKAGSRTPYYFMYATIIVPYGWSAIAGP